MILAMRTLFVGVLLVAAIQFAALARRRRADVITSLAAVVAALALVVVGARVVLASGPTPFESGVALRLCYSAYVVGSIALPLALRALRRREAWGASVVGLVVLAGLWSEGAAFAADTVHRAPTAGDSLDVLAPGRLWLPIVAGLASLMAFSAWAGVRTTEPSLRWLVRVQPPAVVAVAMWDVLDDAGIVEGPILSGWIAAIAIAWLTVVAFRRAIAAHGDLVQRLDQERLALEREQTALAAHEHMSALGSLADGLGHELNNPLAAVSLNLAWLEDEMLASSGRVPDSLEAARAATAELQVAMAEFSSRFGLPGPSITSVPPVSAPRRAQPKVLVVDDDPLVTKALARSLLGFDVTTANSADEAVEAMGAARFDAILCDVMMPEVTGIELYQQVVDAQPELAERFVFLTGGTFGEGGELTLDDLPCPVLRKPVDAAQIARTLRRRMVAAGDGRAHEADEGPRSAGPRGRG